MEDAQRHAEQEQRTSQEEAEASGAEKEQASLCSDNCTSRGPRNPATDIHKCG